MVKSQIHEIFDPNNLHFNDLWVLYNVAFFINIVFAFQALQHGLGECEGDVDRGSKEWEGEEEV